MPTPSSISRPLHIRPRHASATRRCSAATSARAAASACFVAASSVSRRSFSLRYRSTRCLACRCSLSAIEGACSPPSRSSTSAARSRIVCACCRTCALSCAMRAFCAVTTPLLPSPPVRDAASSSRAASSPRYTSQHVSSAACAAWLSTHSACSCAKAASAATCAPSAGPPAAERTFGSGIAAGWCRAWPLVSGGGGGGESSPLLPEGELSDACPREGDGGAASARSARSLSRTLSSSE
mmetsp:Transcript_14358/g.42220  ORF Transcript_14358/g.42220 Transcript_14358/m.42220 type:complete len:239 (-) Transcript_14358:158-874(-)